MAAEMNGLLPEPKFKEGARRVGEAITADIDRSSLVDEMETIAAGGRWASQQPLRRHLQGTASRSAGQAAPGTHDVPGAPRRPREGPQACATRQPYRPLKPTPN